MFFFETHFIKRVVVFSILPIILFSATFVVNNLYTGPGADTLPGTLFYATDSAAANPGYDLIIFQVSGRFAYTTGGNSYINIGYYDELDGISAPGGPYSVIIDSIEVRVAGGAEVHHITLKHAQFYCYGSGGTVRDNIIDSSMGFYGGGVHVDGDSFTIVDNVIIRSFSDGVYVASGNNNYIGGNYIGTDTLGTRGLGNTRSGITVTYNATETYIESNVISGNKEYGITCSGDSVYIRYNFIGTTPDGTDTLGNYYNGISFSMLSGSGSYAVVSSNIVSGNGNNTSPYQSDKFGIYANRIKNLVVDSNFIGVDTSGTVSLPNRGGIMLDGDPWAGYPDSAFIAFNVISGNRGYGMLLYGNGIHIYNNLVGLNIYGDSILKNSYRGIHGWLKNSIIEYNYFCGNSYGGVYLLQYYGENPDSNEFYGNRFGLGADGSTPYKNRFFGLRIDSANYNVIGNDTMPINYFVDPLKIYGGAHNLIENNYFGSDTTGNPGAGIEGENGIYLNNSNFNTIENNLILKCGKDGIRIDNNSTNNVIFDNLIGLCDSNGITVIGDGSVYNQLSENRIYNNRGIAIDLGNDGVTLNDSGDVDTGPNDLFNYPVILGATQVSSEQFTVYGTSAPYSTVSLYWVYFYVNSTGHGDAYQLLGSTIANDTGYFEMNVNLSPGNVITALAEEYDTDNTSELSENFILPGSAPDIELSEYSHNFGPVSPGDSADWTLLIYNQGDDTLTVDSLVLHKPVFKVVSPTFPRNITPGASIDVLIRFLPDDTVAVYDTLDVFSNDPDEAWIYVSLSGGSGTGIVVGKTQGEPTLRLLTNPVFERAIVEFSGVERDEVCLRVYDVSGRLVKTLFNGRAESGRHRVIWHVKHTGVFFIVLKTGDKMISKKTIIMR